MNRTASGLIDIHSCADLARPWLDRFYGQRPLLAITLGFTATGLLPGISAAGATPEARRWTALADAECLVQGPKHPARFPLPPLQAGASPTLISRAVVAGLQVPTWLLAAGMPQLPPVPCVSLGGEPARCLTEARAMTLPVVHHLWRQGWRWGNYLAQASRCGYLVLGECVVGGTTTALALLLGLGIEAQNCVSSSHRTCNHGQKLRVVRQGLARIHTQDPLELVAAVGDPMQPVVAAMAMAASLRGGVLLAGGTQMLAVYQLMRACSQAYGYPWQPQQVMVGTTRWVVEDNRGRAVDLARSVGAPLLATSLSFAASSYPQLRAYEQGFVKEGMGAGGCAIAASLYGNWQHKKLLGAVESTLETQIRCGARTSRKQDLAQLRGV